MSRPGDWNCRSCQHLNFQRRDSCHRCGETRSSGGLERSGGGHGYGYGRSSSSSSLLVFGLGGVGSSTGPDVRPGDWYCTAGNCGTHNFASRSTCFNCGTSKDEFLGGSFDTTDQILPPRPRGGGGIAYNPRGGSSSSQSGWKSGDWICTRAECKEHNFASRMECFRCNAPRDSGSLSSY